MISRHSVQAISLFIVMTIVGCSSTSSGPAVHDPIQEDPVQEPDAAIAEPPPTGPRALTAPASFTQIVQAANTLDDQGRVDATLECLLQRPDTAGWPWMLNAGIATSVRPLPEPPEDLDERLEGSPTPVLVITRWGQIGNRSHDVAFAAFTNAPQMIDRPAVVVIITNRGVYLRRTDRLVSASRSGAYSFSEVPSQLEELIGPGEIVYVSGEAEIPIAQTVRLLRLIPETSPIAFAVALGAEIRVPDPPEPPVDRATGLCPDGLPELPEDAAQGQLEPALIVGALGPLREAVRRCMSEMAGTRQAGGRVEIAMRIGEQGTVTEACLVSDELGGSQLRDCLIRAARDSRFPPPRPAGVVDVSLPLRLQPTYQVPLCE